nr:hypothetical protein [Legionella jordanis]
MSTLELLRIREINRNGMGICLRPKARLVLTATLIDEIRRIQNRVVEEYFKNPWEGNFYLIWYLDNGVNSFSKDGFDYHFIRRAFKAHREKDVENYIEKIFDILFLNYVGLALPLINCSIVNKTTAGIFREFFLLNKICFLFNKTMSQGEIRSFTVNTEFKNLIFNERIYQSNSFFYFDALRLGRMRKAIQSVKPESLSRQQIECIENEFNQTKKEFLIKVYQYVLDATTKQVSCHEQQSYF